MNNLWLCKSEIIFFKKYTTFKLFSFVVNIVNQLFTVTIWKFCKAFWSKKYCFVLVKNDGGVATRAVRRRRREAELQVAETKMLRGGRTERMWSAISPLEGEQHMLDILVMKPGDKQPGRWFGQEEGQWFYEQKMEWRRMWRGRGQRGTTEADDCLLTSSNPSIPSNPVPLAKKKQFKPAIWWMSTCIKWPASETDSSRPALGKSDPRQPLI